jgi:hypothetical protein
MIGPVLATGMRNSDSTGHNRWLKKPFRNTRKERCAGTDFGEIFMISGSFLALFSAVDK